MEETTSRVPAVIDALVTRLTGAQGCQVVDGPRAAQDVENDVVVIGMPDGSGEAVTSTIERAQGLGNRLNETFAIWGVISSFAGDVDIKPRRDRVAAIFADLDAALKQDRALGGVADIVGLGGDLAWRQAQTKDGAVCEVSFQIVGRAAL